MSRIPQVKTAAGQFNSLNRNVAQATELKTMRPYPNFNFLRIDSGQAFPVQRFCRFVKEPFAWAV